MFTPFGSSSSDIQGTMGAGGLSLGLAGMAGSIYEGFQQAGYQAQAAGISQQISGFDQQINNQRQQQMMLQSQRQQVQNLRNTQRAKAAGLSAAVGSGAQYGSGLAGAQAGETAMGAYNERNINQNEQIANNIFGLDSQINQDQIRMAGVESKAATASGFGSLFGGASSMGSGIMGAAKFLGPLMGA